MKKPDHRELCAELRCRVDQSELIALAERGVLRALSIGGPTNDKKGRKLPEHEREWSFEVADTKAWDEWMKAKADQRDRDLMVRVGNGPAN